MNGELVECLPSQDASQVREAIQDLRREIFAVRQEVADLRRRNLELRQEAGYWKSGHADARVRMERLEAEVEQLRGENRQLRARLFGPKSESSTSPDGSNHLPGETAHGALASQPRGPRPGRPGPQRRDYSHLPVVEDLIELPAEDRVCARCGLPSTPSDTEDSEQLEIEVRAYRRRIRRRRYQRTCECPGPRTLVAPPPGKLVPKGRLGVSVWVEILLGKFFSHQAVERQLGEWRLRGLDLAAGTVSGGLERLAPLFHPLYEALLARSAQAGFAQATETRWLVFSE